MRVAAAGALLLMSGAAFADWKISGEADRMTGQPNATASVIGDPITGPARGDWPLLAISCTSSGPGIALRFGKIIGSQKTSQITYKFGASAPVSAKWIMPSFKDAYLIENDAAAFFEQAKSSTKLLIRIADMTIGTSDIEFSIGGGSTLATLPCARSQPLKPLPSQHPPAGRPKNAPRTIDTSGIY